MVDIPKFEVIIKKIDDYCIVGASVNGRIIEEAADAFSNDLVFHSKVFWGWSDTVIPKIQKKLIKMGINEYGGFNAPIRNDSLCYTDMIPDEKINECKKEINKIITKWVNEFMKTAIGYNEEIYSKDVDGGKLTIERKYIDTKLNGITSFGYAINTPNGSYLNYLVKNCNMEIDDAVNKIQKIANNLEIAKNPEKASEKSAMGVIHQGIQFKCTYNDRDELDRVETELIKNINSD